MGMAWENVANRIPMIPTAIGPNWFSVLADISNCTPKTPRFTTMSEMTRPDSRATGTG